MFIKVQIWLVQSLDFKVESLRFSTINSNLFFLRDFIDLILYSPILTFLVCHSFLILFYLRNSRIGVFASDTASWHLISVSSSLPPQTFLLMVASNCGLFCLSWSLRKLRYANVKGSFSGRTTTVIFTVLTNVLSFSWKAATVITLSNTNNTSNNSKKQAL